MTVNCEECGKLIEPGSDDANAYAIGHMCVDCLMANSDDVGFVGLSEDAQAQYADTFVCEDCGGRFSMMFLGSLNYGQYTCVSCKDKQDEGSDSYIESITVSCSRCGKSSHSDAHRGSVVDTGLCVDCHYDDVYGPERRSLGMLFGQSSEYY